MCIPVQVLLTLGVVGALPYTVERRALSQADIVPSGVGEEKDRPGAGVIVCFGSLGQVVHHRLQQRERAVGGEMEVIVQHSSFQNSLALEGEGRLASDGSSSVSEELSSGLDVDSSGWEELLSDGLSGAVEDGLDEQPAAVSISSAARRSAHRRRVNFMGIPPFLRGSVTHIIMQELEADKPV